MCSKLPIVRQRDGHPYQQVVKYVFTPSWQNLELFTRKPTSGKEEFMVLASQTETAVSPTAAEGWGSSVMDKQF